MINPFLSFLLICLLNLSISSIQATENLSKDNHRSRIFQSLYSSVEKFDEIDPLKPKSIDPLKYEVQRDPMVLSGIHPKGLEDIEASRMRLDYIVIKGVIRKMYKLLDELPALLEVDPENPVYLPAQDDAIRSSWQTFLNYRTVLFRMMVKYGDYPSIKNPKKRQKAILMSFGCGIILYKISAEMVLRFYNNQKAWKKLNEGDKTWGVPPNQLFKTMRKLTQKNVKHSLELAYIDYVKSYGEKKVRERSENHWLHKRIKESYEYLQSNALSVWKTRWRIWKTLIKRFFYKPYYHMQKAIATWIGDVKYRNIQPMITHELVQTIIPDLKPGDILIERRNWVLSNAFLPGFWPHGALYVGTAKDLRDMGLDQEPAVARHLEEFDSNDVFGYPYRVVEALSEGVLINSAENSMNADSVAVLRPNVSLEIKKKAIIRAFSHLGKSYDFEFDFFTSDKLVCTEVLYRSYSDDIHLELKKIMGRMALPALSFVHKFHQEFQTANQELELIFFLDGEHKKRKVFFKGPKEFIKSRKRQKLTFLQ